MHNSDYHIEEAVHIFEKIIDFDIDLFIDVVWTFFEENGILSTNQIYIVFKLTRAIRLGKPLYYKIDNKTGNLRLFRKADEESKLFNYTLPEKNIFSNCVLSAIQAVKAVSPNSKLQEGSQNVKERLVNWLKRERVVNSDDRYGLISECYKHFKGKTVLLGKLNTQLYYHFCKSFLNAEYLMLDNYSELLKDAVDKFDDAMKVEYTFEINYFYPVKSFVKLAWRAQQTCHLIKRNIEDPASHLLLVTSDPEQRFISLYGANFIGREESEVYENFLESVIDMTAIDHCFQVNVENFQKLMLLSERKEQLGKAIRRVYFPFQWIDEFILTMQMAESKTASLLYCMQYKLERALIESRIFPIIDEKRSWEQRKQKFNQLRIPDTVSNRNPFIYMRNENIDKAFSLEEDILLQYETGYNSKGSDLARYDETVKEGIKNYCKDSNFFQAVKQDNKKIDFALIKNYAEIKSIKSPSFYIKAIPIVYYKIERLLEKAKNDNELKLAYSKITLLKHMLDKLLLYKRTYTSSLPHQYRPLFTASFYSCTHIKGDNYTFDYVSKLSIEDINGYTYKNFTDKFFFRSLACSPAYPEGLDMLYTDYDRKRRTLTTTYDKKVDDFTQVEMSEIRKMAKFAKSKTSTIEKLHNDFKGAEKRVDAKLSNQLTHTVTVLGIFATILAFVSISIGTISIARNMVEYMLFSATFVVSLSVFAILILHHTSKANEIGNRRTNLKYVILLLSIIALILISIFHSKLSGNSNPSSSNTTIEIKANKGH